MNEKLEEKIPETLGTKLVKCHSETGNSKNSNWGR